MVLDWHLGTLFLHVLTQGFVVRQYTSIVLHKTYLIAYAENTILIAFTDLVGEFDILDEDTSTQGVAYDYSSVMHPGVNEFGKKGKETIAPLKSTGRSYGPKYPSTLDILHIGIMYCEGNYYIYSIH